MLQISTVVQNDLKVEALLVKDLEIPVFVERSSMFDVVSGIPYLPDSVEC